MKNIYKTIIIFIFLNINSYAKDIFIDLSTGYTHAAYTKKDISGSIQIDDLDDNGYLYELAIGYRLSKEVFTTLNYQYSKLDEIEFDDYYVTLNYQFLEKLKPYVGILLGKSYLRWKEDPLLVSKKKDRTSGSFIYGVQAGLEYTLSNNLSFVSKFIYSRTNHGTNLHSNNAKSYIDHDSKSQLLLGLRFVF